LCLLSRLHQLLFESKPEDGDIRIEATRKWTIDPNNVSSLNAKRYFVSKARSLELVREEALLGILSRKKEISSINRSLGTHTLGAHVPVLPLNLHRRTNKDQ